jgi:hypothetical protein
MSKSSVQFYLYLAFIVILSDGIQKLGTTDHHRFMGILSIICSPMYIWAARTVGKWNVPE